LHALHFFYLWSRIAEFDHIFLILGQIIRIRVNLKKDWLFEWSFVHWGAIQKICDTFSADFRLPFPHVSFGDTGADPGQNTKIWFKILEKMSRDTLANPLHPPPLWHLMTLSRTTPNPVSVTYYLNGTLGVWQLC